MSYVPADGDEILAQLSDGTGGIPLCWPWFSDLGPEGCRRHGLARYQPFSILRRSESPSSSELILQLESNDEIRKEFGKDFRLTVTYRLSDGLSIEMTGENTGVASFGVTEMFHPYLRVGEVAECKLKGLGNPFIGVGPQLVDLPSAEEHVYELEDSVLGRTIRLSSSGDRTVVVWNPGNGVRRAANMTSVLAPDEWRHFVCMENGTARKEDAYLLPPGGRHALALTIRAVKAEKKG